MKNHLLPGFASGRAMPTAWPYVSHIHITEVAGAQSSIVSRAVPPENSATLSRAAASCCTAICTVACTMSATASTPWLSNQSRTMPMAMSALF